MPMTATILHVREGVTVRVEDKALDFLVAVRSLLAKLVAGQHDLLEVVTASLAAVAAEHGRAAL